jgi:hypothetical protein
MKNAIRLLVFTLFGFSISALALNENYKNSNASDQKVKWSRPAHTIDANVAATKSAKEKRKLETKS